jgi:fibro-slime domain-containing protein
VFSALAVSRQHAGAVGTGRKERRRGADGTAFRQTGLRRLGEASILAQSSSIEPRRDVMRKKLYLAAGASTAAVIAVTYLVMSAKTPRQSSADASALPAVQNVVGIVRDFPPTHPDFNVTPSNGYGHYCGNIAEQLDADGKPQFIGNGFRVAQEWRDRQSRQIAWCTYSAAYDDHEGKGQKGSLDNGAISSAASFAQWFRDVPGVNMSRPHTLTLTLGSNGMYEYQTNDFHPIDNALLGNDVDDKNFHFTFEIAANFTYDPSTNPVIEFVGDDDIWVFIDNRLVIDLGGIAGNSTQFIDLARLNLTPGEHYVMKFFHAERKQPKSQFRFRTTILFDGSSLPAFNNQFD